MPYDDFLTSISLLKWKHQDTLLIRRYGSELTFMGSPAVQKKLAEEILQFLKVAEKDKNPEPEVIFAHYPNHPYLASTSERLTIMLNPEIQG